MPKKKGALAASKNKSPFKALKPTQITTPKRVSSKHVFASPVSKTYNVDGGFPMEEIETTTAIEDPLAVVRREPTEGRRQDWTRDEVDQFRKSLRINWDDLLNTWAKLGGQNNGPSDITSQRTRTLIELVTSALATGQFDEAKVVVDTLIQLKAIEKAIV